MKTKKNKIKKNKSMKNKKKNKIGGALECSYYPNIEKNQQHELLTQEIDPGIIKSIERVKKTPTDILHIIIGGNCQDPTRIAPESIEYEYLIDCNNSRGVTIFIVKIFLL